MSDAHASIAIVDRLSQPFRELVFSEWDSGFLETSEGQADMRVALVDRYLASRRHAVAWLDDAVGLSGVTVVEVGCGTGASTVALAERGAKVVALDIDSPSVAAARLRVEAHQVDGVVIEQCEATHILERALAERADLYVLFAVLEHLTDTERFETLRGLWDALEPGGAIAIVETPNRLSYYDSHSAVEDFVHLLPDELAFRLKDRSPRQAYRDVMRQAIEMPDPESAHLVRARFGLGASFHEFLAAIDEPLDEIVIADGYEDTITSWFGNNLEETTLLQYLLERDTDVPMAFARPVLNVVLRRPRNDSDRREASERNAKRRIELADVHRRPPADWRFRINELEDRAARQERELHECRAALAILETPEQSTSPAGSIWANVRRRAGRLRSTVARARL